MILETQGWASYHKMKKLNVSLNIHVFVISKNILMEFILVFLKRKQLSIAENYAAIFVDVHVDYTHAIGS